MARFRATIKGQRGEISRLGSITSGLRVTVNGWTSGLVVVARYEPGLGCDVFDMYGSGGSNGSPGDRIGHFRNGSWYPDKAEVAC